VWDRTGELHATASALIVHRPSRRVLLRWHDRQRAWIQVGGHADPGESDALAIAVREAVEETGLTDVTPFDERPIHVVVVPVPANDREPAHRHGDIRFVLTTERPDDAVPEHATAPLRWLTIADAIEATTEENVRESLRRLDDAFPRVGPR
jgi:8-oxo-dGTP pyrophosphatase MutT (NUDIX family)